MNEKSGLIRAAAYRHAHVHNWLFLGRGVYYPVALESALKMKEVTYVHAEGMPGGFLKHGTLSLVDDKLYTLVFVPPPSAGELHAMTMSSVEEVKARGGFVFGFTFDANEDIFDERLVLSATHDLTAPFLPHRRRAVARLLHSDRIEAQRRQAALAGEVSHRCVTA